MAAKLIEIGNKENVFVAIDRDSRRFKLDKEYKDEMTAFRERMDIADFDLQKFIAEK